jgi:signal transduction histidine kinase
MNKDEFDEMQVKIRDKIGRQMFTVLVLLLLLDALLYYLGFRWINYPFNIQVIVLVCCAFYGFRLALEGSLFGRKQLSGRSVTSVSGVSVISLIVTTVLCLVAIVVIGYFFKPSTLSSTSHIGTIPTIIIQVISWGTVIAMLVIQYVKQHHENDK